MSPSPRTALVLSGGGARGASDLLFDREFAGELVALGHDDARRMRAALLDFSRAPAPAAAEPALGG